MKLFNKYLRHLLLMLVLLITDIETRGQCITDFPVTVGTVSSYEFSGSGIATNITWSVSGIGTIISDKNTRECDVRWNQIGTGTIAVEWYESGQQMNQCWTRSVVAEMLGGTITSSVTSFPLNQIFSYTVLTSTEGASGGIGKDYNVPYTYKWQESTDGNNWTMVVGAVGLNGSGSILFDKTMYFRRQAFDGYNFAFSNVLTVTLANNVTGGIISAAQKVLPGNLPAKLVNTISAAGGNGSFAYQWESSTDEDTWAVISGATAADYQPTALSKTTWFRRKVTSLAQTANSNVIQILVKSAITTSIPDGSLPQSTQTKISPPNYSTVNTSLLNTITSYDILKPGITETSQINSLTSQRDIRTTTEYIDGLRRVLETVQQNVGLAAQDAVALSQFDKYGRQTIQHLPYLAATNTTNKGTFRVDINTAQPAFFNTITQNNEDFFYQQMLTEPSPVARSGRSINAGKSYGGNNIGNRQSERTNTAADHVRLWRIGNTITDYPVSNIEYDPNTLTVTVTTDNDGFNTYKYFDNDGKVVMTARQGVTPLYTDELRTYFVYDDFDNVRYIIPPLATKDWWSKAVWDFSSTDVTKAALKSLAFKYYYDAKGRIINMEKAGIDNAYSFVYDNRNRLVLVQDATLKSRNKGEWYLYLYDNMDRQTIVAIYTNTSATRESLQASMDQAPATGIVPITTPLVKDLVIYNNEHTPTYVAGNSITAMPGFETDAGEEADFSINTTTNTITENLTVTNPLPGLTGYTPLVIYYYDNYTWDGVQGFDKNYTLNAGNNPYAQTFSTPSQNIYGKLTGYKKIISGTNNWIKGTLYYDEKGRTVQQLESNVKGGTDVTTNQYDFQNNLLSSFSRITNPQSTTDPIIYIQERMEYDGNGNMLQQYHSVSTSLTPTSKLVHEMTYDDLNRIKTWKIGPSLETLTLDYDLFNRVTGVNTAYINDKSAGNYFGMQLFYNSGFSGKKLDGNLSGTIWRRKGDADVAHAYGYTYDTHNRLVKADYSQKASSWTNSSEDYTVAISQYDENGNIVKMKQEGMLAGKAKATIDDLTYDYPASSNRLNGITDTQGDKNVGDFKNYSGRAAGSIDYIYDAAGNITGDKNRSITFSYDFLLGKPQKISFDNNANKYITYTNDITGNLLERTVKNESTTNTYTYINGAVYKDNVLQYVLFDEGRVRKTANNTFVYDYILTDQLGNTRTVITEETNTYGYKATHETNPNPAPAVPERELFSFPVQVDDIPSGNKFYDYNGTTNRKFVKLNYTDPNRRVGTGKVLKVMAGDHVDLGVLSYYATNSDANNTVNQPLTDILSQLVNVLLGPASVVANGKGNLLQGVNGSILNQQDFLTFIQQNQNNNPPSTTPKAYLNYALFDDNFTMVTGGALRVNTPGDVVPLAAQLDISKNGFLYVYVSNESNSDVYFDDLAIKHTTGHLLQEDSYYPFGLEIQALGSAALNRLQHNYLFNGIEKINDLDLQLYQTFYRTFDPQTGRWMQVDPRTEEFNSISGYANNFNNPVNLSDPFGDAPLGIDPPWWSQFFQGYGMNGNSPILLSTFEVIGTNVARANASEQIMNFATNDYLDIERRKQLYAQMYWKKRIQAYTAAKDAQRRKFFEQLQQISKINNIKPPTNIDPGTIREYVPDWKDKWAESDNFFAQATYEPVDDGWVLTQSLIPFLSINGVTHIDGQTANNNDKVKGLVGVANTVVGDHVGGMVVKGMAIPLIGRLGRAAEKRGLWALTEKAASVVKQHRNSFFGKFYKSASDGLWWSVDKTGHGKSKFKVFKETAKGLEWIADADEFGDFIIGKHKGDTGKFIEWKDLF
ncbi:DUF6443 domain-containing protein [Chitinophaga filiformis]|uniref:DUF6443 domain-containing protein n=1 Tax=Chitinophaga filiformis TaxID=104663 RepID=UPI001F40106A|nr:DUF6443 domain-containing protein [Chitinophaga filiformis]MCF6402513.1 DUF6443 domain-containing protein [Chitinophaga filiformis]